MLIALALASLTLALSIAGNTPDDIVKEQGFLLQKYYATTEDGYILEIWRWNDLYETETDEALAQRPPIGFLHGIFDVGLSFGNNYRNNSLGYMLFDLGYDVWSVNFRGNTFSQAHETFHTDSTEFWAFDSDQSGFYDIPAFVDTILAHSAHDRVFLNCHSMGCTSLYALLASLDVYAFDYTKIRATTTLGPVVYASNIANIAAEIILDLPEELTVEILYDVLGEKALLTHDLFDPWAPEVCFVLPELCYDIMTFVGGENTDPDAVDADRIYLYVNNYPGGSSVRALAHFVQIADSGNFQAYDFGLEQNVAAYGQQHAPVYDLAAVPADLPLYLIGGTNDALGDPEDVYRMHEELSCGDRVDYRFAMVDTYTHQDMIWAMNAPEMLYNLLIDYYAEFL
eukprot:gnl/Chilomastix_cuspidata/678.p2 GENE.gnl/Chilomastix_cuspidata/678~~gnl/Chilomastix_cuspidata/678.p2  ORF type:complete len:398 (+),score=174.21 gnl/Chilomastix_cuspidata/678:1317-2510(+)